MEMEEFIENVEETMLLPQVDDKRDKASTLRRQTSMNLKGTAVTSIVKVRYLP
jgi:hypothetical protein